MSYLDRKDLLSADLMTRSISKEGSIEYYNSDKNVANIYMKLMAESPDGAQKEVSVDEASNYTVTIDAIKSKTNQIRTVPGVLSNDLTDETCAIWKFELGEDLTNQIGEVICQTYVKNTTQNLTMRYFNYTVKADKLTGLNSEIVTDPDFPILKSLIEEVKETAQTVNNIDDVNITDTKTFSNKKIEEKFSGVDAQFNTIENKKADSKLYNISKTKSCVTIIFDDISEWDYTKLFPILKEKNVRIGQACLIDWVGTTNNSTPFATWEQIKEMAEFGNEIISHSIRQDIHYTALTDIELNNYFLQSRDALRSKGYNSDIIAYTWGDSDVRIRKFARKYYRCAFAITGSETVKYSNGSTLDTYNIARVGLNGEDAPQSQFPSNTDSIEYLKARVDYAKANNQWLVFMGHSFMFTDTSKNKTQQFKDLIDYIKSVGLDIVVPSVGLERMGNSIDLVANEDETKYFKINSKGQIKSNINDVWDVDTFSSSNKCKDFRLGISVTSISTSKAQTDGGFPTTTGGTLVTYNPFSSDLGYQEYATFNGLRWQRWVNSDGGWSSWLNILPPKLYNTTITVPSITVPAKQSYNYLFKTGGTLTNLSDATLYPTTNVENGLIFNHWIMPDGTVVIRFSNFTDSEITTVARDWKLTSIQLR